MGATTPFDYAQLEQAVFYQYGLGSSTNVVSQASRLLAGFPKNNAFPVGNKAVAFLASAAFLRSNGYDLTVDDSGLSRWLDSMWESPSTAAEAVKSAVASHGYHGESLQQIVDDLMERYRRSLEVLKDSG